MNNDKFLIAMEIKKFIFSLDKVLINFPRKDIMIKKNILSESIRLLELTYLANNSKDDRESYQDMMLVSISMIDFYFEYSYKKQYISLNVLNSKINHLTKINKMVYGWIKSNGLQTTEWYYLYLWEWG